MLAHSVILFFLLSCLSPVQCADDCYYPDGTLSDDYYTCDYYASYSACCPAGFACVTNNFCFGNGTEAITRGLCSDSKWQSDACPQYCDQVYPFGDLTAVDTDIQFCEESLGDGDAWEYEMCCHIDDDCCTSSSTRFFTVPDGFYTTAYWDGLDQLYQTLATAEASTVYLTTTYSGLFTTSTSTTELAPTSSSTYTTSSSIAITPVPNLPTSGSSSSSSVSGQQDDSNDYQFQGDDGISNGRIGGIVAGVVLIVGAFIGALLYKWRKKRSRNRPNPAFRHNNPHHYGVRQDSDIPDNGSVMVEADAEAARPVELAGKTYVEAPGRESPGSSSVEKQINGSEVGEDHETDGLVREQNGRKVSHELEVDEDRGRQ